MLQSPQIRAYLALAFALLIFAGQGIVLKVLINPPHGYTGLQIGYIRQSIAALVLLPIAGVMIWRNRHSVWQHRSFLIKGGLLGFFIHGISFNVGLEYTTALNAYIISALVPVFAAMISIIVFKQSVSLHTVFYIVLSILGVVIIVSKGDINTLATLQMNVGDILLIWATFLWAVYGFVTRNRPPAINLTVFMFIGLALSSVFTLPLLWITGDHHLQKDVWDMDFTALMFYAAVISQIISLLAYGYALTVLDGVIPAIGMNTLPVMGSILAILILDEVFHPYHAIAVALIGVSVYKIVMRDIRQR